MPQFVLEIKCELENARLSWDPSNTWAMLVQSPDASESCEAFFSRDEEAPLEGSRGTAHFIKKWPGERKQAYLKIVESAQIKTSYDPEDSQEWVPILQVEARGLEPVGWMPRNDFTVTSGGGSVWGPDEVEFEDGTWNEYCQENDGVVTVENLEFRINPHH